MFSKTIHLSDKPSDISLLRLFYTGLYTREFPDADERESLENMENYLRLKAQGWYGKNNYHILLGLDEQGGIIGGVVADYFHGPNTGLIEFIVVDGTLRGQGLGRRLMDEIGSCFESDSHRAGHPALDGICAEVNDPYRRCDIEEHLDGFARLRMWHRLGFGLLDFPYVQPALGEGQEAVLGLGLMFSPLNPSYATAVPSPLVEEIVRDFQIWAMRIANPDAMPEFSAIRNYLRQRPQVPVLDMMCYVGEVPSPGFSVVSLGKKDPRFPEFAELYTREFRDAATTVEISAFRVGSGKCDHEGICGHYCLWGLEPVGRTVFEGFASFFSLPHCGFGGYLALCDGLRGKGHLRQLIRLIERAIVSSSASAGGWYVECDMGSPEASVFRHCGFSRVPITYLQPRLPDRASGDTEDTRLDLLFKPFGRIYGEPFLSGTLLRRDLAEIFSCVYRLAPSETATSFARMNLPEGDGDLFSTDGAATPSSPSARPNAE